MGLFPKIRLMITTDILVIGAGPTGLFTVFEAGLLKLKCHLIDALPQPGGQLTELYPKKPIFDIPGFPSINAGDLVDNLMEQTKQFQPGFTLGETAQTLTKLEDGTFEVITNKGTVHRAKAVAIAGGLGTFEPRKPVLENLADYEEKGVEYFIKEPEHFRDKKVVIAGGGDSALDWSIFLANIASEVTLIHRRNEFRGALDSVEKVQALKDQGKIHMMTPAEVIGLKGDGKLNAITVVREGETFDIETDYFIPLFGLTPKLGDLAINTYPGKLKLILCGFHEATLMCQSIYNMLNPGKKFVLKYTTVSGIDGFDGSRKEAEKAVVMKID